MGMADLPQSVKGTLDVAAGATIAASWLDFLRDGLEIFGLALAVAYGVARLYDTKMYRDIVQWMRGRKPK